MTVSPSGRTHFFAALGGNVIVADLSIGAAFRLAILNIIPKTKDVSRTRSTIFQCRFERVAQKNVSGPMITWVGRDDRVESFGKSNFLHENKRALSARPTTLRAKLWASNYAQNQNWPSSASR